MFAISSGVGGSPTSARSAGLGTVYGEGSGRILVSPSGKTYSYQDVMNMSDVEFKRLHDELYPEDSGSFYSSIGKGFEPSGNVLYDNLRASSEVARRDPDSKSAEAKDDFWSNVEGLFDKYLDSFNTGINALSTSAMSAQAEQAAAVNEFNRIEAEKVRNFNSAEAAKARAWQERMDNTAYQRLVTDLRSAGLNPILAFQSANPQTGSAASASSGAAANGVQANLASAKNADKVEFSDFISMLILPVLSSALSVVKDISQFLH